MVYWSLLAWIEPCCLWFTDYTYIFWCYPAIRPRATSYMSMSSQVPPKTGLETADVLDAKIKRLCELQGLSTWLAGGLGINKQIKTYKHIYICIYIYILRYFYLIMCSYIRNISHLFPTWFAPVPVPAIPAEPLLKFFSTFCWIQTSCWSEIRQAASLTSFFYLGKNAAATATAATCIYSWFGSLGCFVVHWWESDNDVIAYPQTQWWCFDLNPSVFWP